MGNFALDMEGFTEGNPIESRIWGEPHMQALCYCAERMWEIATEFPFVSWREVALRAGMLDAYKRTPRIRHELPDGLSYFHGGTYEIWVDQIPIVVRRYCLLFGKRYPNRRR